MNVGIVLNHLGASQLSFYTIAQCNQLKDDDYYIFFNLLQPICMKSEVACMNSSEIHGFKGMLIATDLNTANAVINTITPSHKLFYVWDLEWLRGQNDFLHNISIYRNIDLIARSEHHAQEIYNYTNIKPKIIENLNLKEIVEYGRSKDNK